jgi:hypothetical protein
MTAQHAEYAIAPSDGTLSITVNANGVITCINLPEWQRQVLSHPVPLMAIRQSGHHHTSSQLDYAEDGRLTISFTESDCRIRLRVEMARNRVNFEVEGIDGGLPDELTLLSVPVTMCGLVGESAGIVQEESIAFGVQGLNWYTDAAAAQEEGAVRLLVSADRRSGFIGARYAVFACPREECLSFVEQLQREEPGLPYFTDDNGDWLRTSSDIGKPYIAMSHEGFTAERALDYAVRGGFPILYLGAMTWTRVWGHFEVYKGAFPGGESELIELGQKALAKGIRLGFHTLSGAISGSDRYVSPTPDSRLATTGSGRLTNTAESDSSVMTAGEIAGDFCRRNAFYTSATEGTEFDTLLPGGAFRVGSEIIRCQSMKMEGDSVVLGGCHRGEYGTAAARHDAGEPIVRLFEAWALACSSQMWKARCSTRWPNACRTWPTVPGWAFPTLTGWKDSTITGTMAAIGFCMKSVADGIAL